MYKKSQIHTEVFVYILALIIVSFIVVYGYNAARNFQERTKQVSLLTFKTEMEGTISSYVGDYGSRRRIDDITVPSGFNEICFIDLDVGLDQITSTDSNLQDHKEKFLDEYPLLTSSWYNDVSANIFLLRNGIPQFILYVPNLDVRPDDELPSNAFYDCEDISGRRIDFWIEGKGSSVEVWFNR
ncbi:MAG: hypothetical protein ACOCP4_03935 [Candidatus Woesearchaeota archaeon]